MGKLLQALIFGLVITTGMLASSLHSQESVPVAGKAVLPGAVQIRNVRYGLLLRPRDASNKTGAPIVLYPAEPWKCMTWDTRVGEDGLVSLKNRLTAKTVGSGEGETLRQVPLVPETRWKFEPLSGERWRIVDPSSGRVLTARAEQSLVLAEWQDDDSQKWEVLSAPAHLTM